MDTLNFTEDTIHPREGYAQRQGKPEYVLGPLNNVDLSVNDITLS
jgi:hypothetical protein